MEDDRALTKAEIIDSIQNRMGLSRKIISAVVDDLFEVIKSTLETGESVKVSGLGNFVVREKKARPGRNPKSGETMTIPPRRVLTFKPSQAIRQSLKREP